MSQINNYDIHIKQGESWTLTAAITDANNTPKDLTGYTAGCQFRDGPGGATLVDMSVGAGITISAGAGTVTLAQTAAQTAVYEFEQCDYDLAIKSGAGTVTYQVQGRVYVQPRITRMP